MHGCGIYTGYAQLELNVTVWTKNLKVYMTFNFRDF